MFTEEQRAENILADIVAMRATIRLEKFLHKYGIDFS
jgi:hypothetical protein